MRVMRSFEARASRAGRLTRLLPSSPTVPKELLLKGSFSLASFIDGLVWPFVCMLKAPETVSRAPRGRTSWARGPRGCDPWPYSRHDDLARDFPHLAIAAADTRQVVLHD